MRKRAPTSAGEARRSRSPTCAPDKQWDGRSTLDARTPLRVLAADLSARSYEALVASGHTHVRDILGKNVDYFEQIPNIGVSGAREVVALRQRLVGAGAKRRTPSPTRSSRTGSRAGNALGTARTVITPDMPIEDLELSLRSYNALRRAGFARVRQLLGQDERFFLQVRGIGVKGAREIVTACLRVTGGGCPHPCDPPSPEAPVRAALQLVDRSGLAPPPWENANDCLQHLRLGVGALFDGLNPQEQHVIESRSGMGAGACETLREIGARLGVTRERVRQIESKALRRLRAKQRRQCFQRLASGLLTDWLLPAVQRRLGLVARRELPDLIAGDSGLKVHADGLVRLLERVYGRTCLLSREHFLQVEDNVYALDHPTAWLFGAIARRARSLLKRGKRARAADELAQDLASATLPALSVGKRQRFVLRVLELTSEVLWDEGGRLGLREWRHFRPRTVADMADAALRDLGQPAHFTQVALKMNALFPNRGPFADHNVHACIQRDPSRFVWQRPGVYGLADWGLKRPPYLKDALVGLLREAGRPVHLDELRDAALQMCNCAPASVGLTLSFTEGIFVAYTGAYWGLAEWYGDEAAHRPQR